MRLHRLRVANFRGVAEREITFADAGVTVVEGDNEAGKSSMMEAFDLLLTARADSKAKSVRAVQPSGRDVGTEVWAEISCGDWRFEYFKRFHRQSETTLRILEPVAEQWAGREAHEKVEAILAESLDRTLFGALRLLQSADPVLGDLTNSAALSQALDRAVGTGESEGESPQTLELIAAVGAEYGKYFTLAQGRPTGVLADAQAQMREATDAVAEREAILAGVKDATDRLPGVADAIKTLVVTEREKTIVAEEASAAVTEMDAVREKVSAARAVVEAKSMARSAAVDAVKQRTEQRERLARSVASAQATASRIATIEEEAAAASEEAEAAVARIDAAQNRLDAVRADIEQAETTVARASDRARLTRLDTTLGEVRALDRELATARRELEAIAATEDDARVGVSIERELTALTARLDAVAGVIEVVRLGDTAIVIDGETVGDRAEVAATDHAVVDIPGIARIEVRPGSDTASLTDELARVRERERALLERCGVADLDAVARAAARRTEIRSTVADLERRRARELGGADTDDLEGQRREIQSRLPADVPTADAQSPDLAALRLAEREASDHLAACMRARETMLSRAREQRGAATTLRENSADADEAIAAQIAALTAAEAAATDEMLEAAVAAADADLGSARAEFDDVRARLDALDPPTLQVRLAEARADLDRCSKQLTQYKELRTELVTRLEVCRSDGRLDELSGAQSRYDAARTRLQRISERAEGARVLREALERHRAESRARRVDPFVARLEELAAPVFGDDVRFHVTDDFVIANRTLDGVTVDVDALSGGAQEQLGLLARLACATLVDSVDGVPLILDDALGYTDPGRLASIGEVLGSVGDGAQIIVLTCSPDRYNEIAGARRIAV